MLIIFTIRSTLNLKEYRAFFVILSLGAVIMMATISIISPGQLAVAQDGTENSSEADKSESEYKHVDGKDCPFKNKKSLDASTLEENT